MTELAVISNMSLTLTRGLIWMEDVHYNGDKDGPDQGTHTFTWDNVGFDGPTLPRDLGFDAVDRLAPAGDGMLNLGWAVPNSDRSPLSITVPGVYNIANASAALLMFNYFTYNPVTVSYHVNNGAWHDQPWPFGTCFAQNGTTLCGWKTVGVPVPLSDVKPGTNTVEFKSTDGTAIANIDLILAGAAGTPPRAGLPTSMATFTTPSEGAADVDGARPFSWTSAPAAQGYYLTVGTTPGGYDLVNSGGLAAGVTSYPMPAVPAGRSIYARLYSATGGGYVESSDVTFSGAQGAGFTYPLEGQADVDTTQPFSWTQAPNAQGYYVTVGTTPGGFDLFNSGTLPSSASSLFLGPALPTGAPLYARVYTETGGAFLRYQDVKFSARSGRAVLTNPIDGGTVAADLGSFAWTAVDGAVGYVLSVGTGPGKYDVINSGSLPATTTSLPVPPLPKHKRLYARIYSQLNEGHVRVADIIFNT
jgi:hypothetical protein